MSDLSALAVNRSMFLYYLYHHGATARDVAVDYGDIQAFLGLGGREFGSLRSSLERAGLVKGLAKVWLTAGGLQEASGVVCGLSDELRWRSGSGMGPRQACEDEG